MLEMLLLAAIPTMPLIYITARVLDETSRRLDNVKQDGRFTDNHLGRSTGLIVGGYSAMFVAPSF